jgi:hypothetical protein
LSFAFDLIARSLLDFDLVDLSAEIPLDPDTFLETSWIQSEKRGGQSRLKKKTSDISVQQASDDGFSLLGVPGNINVAKQSI